MRFQARQRVGELGDPTPLRQVEQRDVGPRYPEARQALLQPPKHQGQIEGGAVHGLSIALLEQVLTDNGRITNPNLHDYKMATTMDVPQVVSYIVEAPHKDGPFGAKGVGEPVLSPTAAAIANAIEDAIGVRIQSLPLTPERVYAEIEKKHGSQ